MAPTRQEGAKQTAWQRLQDAIAITPTPELPPDTNPAVVPATPAADLPQPDSTGAGRAFLDQFARASVEQKERPEWLKTPLLDPVSTTTPQATEEKSAPLQPRSVWNGTGFEERHMAVPPPPSFGAAPEPVAAPEPQPAPVLEEMSTEAILEKMAEQSSPAVEIAPAPEPQHAELLEETLIEAPSRTPDTVLEGEMWKSANVDAAVPTGAFNGGKTIADAAVATAPFNGAKTAQSAHDQEGSRWFVLNGVLGGKSPQEAPADAPAGNVPVLEVFSLSGGVGKTSLVATLGRALSSLGERVLLVEATPFGSMPYFFGACDSRPGALRTFRPPSSSSDAPIRLASIDPESLMLESAAQGSLAAEIQGWSRGVSRVIVDVSTGSIATLRGLSRMSPLVLVPLVPDVNSVLTASTIDSFFQRQAGSLGGHPDVYYILNQFDPDPSLPLHADVRKMLRERLGDRLLPFAMQRTPAVSEALAEGMTIMDYAPDSAMAADIINLAKWLEDVMAPVDMNSRGRWSER
ncbi:MAG TPA: cellulose synthase operon protein YhjQ/BcsQ [Terracidiphilus sp.]|nr:cellulose synthase operon protein YhjQ/BcsQ [Terracidiphilus sp.]